MKNCSRICLRLFKTLNASNNVITRDRKLPSQLIGLTLCRNSSIDSSRQTEADSTTESKELAKLSAQELLEKEFPDYYQEGKFVPRISYIDFIDEALERVKILGKHRDLETYKELLKVFPPGKYCPSSEWDLGLFHAPQQLSGLRILNQMDIYSVIPDKEVERLVVDRFSIHSQVWLKCTRMNFWFQKARNLDPNPLPEVTPKKTYEIAKVALVRMLEDQKSLVTVTNTSSLPDVVDKTWIVYSQSPAQKGIIEKLEENALLYLEDGGLVWVKDKYLSFYVLKIYDDEETIKAKRKEPEPDHNYNTMKMKFYGKPLREKLKDPEEVHYDGTGYVLALGLTGTSSDDSVLSFLKILQRRNPRLSKMRVLFNLERPTMDLSMANAGAGGPDPVDRKLVE